MRIIQVKILILLSLIIGFNLKAQTNIDDIKGHVEAGHYNKALTLTKEMLKTDSLNTNLWYETGQLYQLTQNYNPAIASFKKAFKLDTTNIKSILALAKVSKKAGKTNASIHYYNDYLKLEPENIAALTNLAIIYLTNYRMGDAFKLFSKLHQLDTTNAEYIRKMANCKFSLGEILEGFDLLKKAYSTDTTNFKVICDLGRIYNASQLYDSTIFLVEKAVKLYPNEGILHAHLGDAHYYKNHHYRSVPAYQKAIELGYTSNKVRKRLGAGLLTIERYKEATEVLEKLITRDTNDYKVCMYLGTCYNELGDPDKGLLFFDKAIDILTPSPLALSSIYTAKASSFHKKGRYDKQIEMIFKRQEILPKEYRSNRYLLEIADIYEKNIEDNHQAVKYYEKYWESIKDSKWYSPETKNGIQAKINRLREEMHFGSK